MDLGLDAVTSSPQTKSPPAKNRIASDNDDGDGSDDNVDEDDDVEPSIQISHFYTLFQSESCYYSPFHQQTH